MSLRSKLGQVKAKLGDQKTASGCKFVRRKVGLVQKLQGKMQAKFGRNTGTCAPACGPDDPACNAGYSTVDVMGMGAAVALVIMLAIAFFLSGCAMQPSRSQTMRIEGNTINIYVVPAVPGALCYSNNLPSGVAGGDTLCQAMMIETGGNESNAQTASADTALNLPMGDTAISALGELIGSAITGGVKAAAKTDTPATTTQ